MQPEGDVPEVECDCDPVGENVPSQGMGGGELGSYCAFWLAEQATCPQCRVTGEDKPLFISPDIV